MYTLARLPRFFAAVGSGSGTIISGVLGSGFFSPGLVSAGLSVSGSFFPASTFVVANVLAGSMSFVGVVGVF